MLISELVLWFALFFGEPDLYDYMKSYYQYNSHACFSQTQIEQTP